MVLEVYEDLQSLQGCQIFYPILFSNQILEFSRRKTRLALSYLLQYPFQEFWRVVFQELDEAFDRVLLVESM